MKGDPYNGGGAGVGAWSDERLAKLGPMWTGPNPRQAGIRSRSKRKAYISGAENFHLLRAGTREGSEGLPPGTMYVTPPIPKELEDANCQNLPKEDREAFFSSPSLSHLSVTVEVQNERDRLWGTYCKGCPVKERCFEWGMAYEEWGIWAGTLEWDRKKMRKDEALLEYGRNRLKSGYIPIPSRKCRCGVVIRFAQSECAKCKEGS